MNFDLTDDQQEIKRTARELLSNRASWERVREAATAGRDDEALWRELSELGWPGIAVAEEHGGQGLGTVAQCVLLEELGYACAPTPFLGTVLAAQAIEHAGSAEQRERWLPALAAGEATGALGLVRGDAAELVPDAPGAAVIVLVDADTGTASLVEGGAEEVAGIDPTRRYGSVRAQGGEALDGDAQAVLDRAAVAVAAELVGVCQRALDMTLEYVKDRKQFGVPVGAFQAVQHRAAQMLLDTEGARSTAYYSAWAADAEPDRLPLAAAMAKAWASDAGRSVTAASIQLHGGVGFTWEADLHWLFKRAQHDSALLGGAGAHRARVAQIASSERAAAVR